MANFTTIFRHTMYLTNKKKNGSHTVNKRTTQNRAIMVSTTHQITVEVMTESCITCQYREDERNDVGCVVKKHGKRIKNVQKCKILIVQVGGRKVKILRVQTWFHSCVQTVNKGSFPQPILSIANLLRYWFLEAENVDYSNKEGFSLHPHFLSICHIFSTHILYQPQYLHVIHY